MLRQRNAGTVMTGVWLAVILLAVAASLLYTNLVTAQESSTEATLSAPALTAEAGEGEGAVELRWEAVTGAARYELLVWTSADGFQDIGGDNLTGTTYSHTGLAAGTTYYYTVRAVDAGGVTDPWSEYASATVAAALSKPVLTAEGGEGAVELRWEAVTGAVRYELVAWTSGAADWQEIGGDNLTGTTYSHTGLAAGTTYYYMVRAVDAGGVTGPWSEYVSATVAAAQSTPVADTADREVLVALYNGTDGANWANNSNWLSERPLGDWHGVTTDGNGRVTTLYLEENQLSGPIPAALGNLNNLTQLILYSNQLSGPIPAELGNLNNLTQLILAGNQLSGTIPSELGNLSNLTLLHLAGN